MNQTTCSRFLNTVQYVQYLYLPHKAIPQMENDKYIEKPDRTYKSEWQLTTITILPDKLIESGDNNSPQEIYGMKNPADGS